MAKKEETKEMKQAFDTPITERIPWKKASESSDIPLKLDYFIGSMYEALEKTAKEQPNAIA
ncbi:MAG: hypothetical protein IIY56_02085, partial [Erysipelotrichaceae bacterium]|nr:hypothetical protein [Erysipelotrichaceae bacterium]